MISIVIPTLNEEAALPKTLRSLAEQDFKDYEVIVVDGGSTDRTCEIIKQNPKNTLVYASRGRALQMNAGAKLAKGDWLLFLHADTELPSDALRQIIDLSQDPSVKAGGFLHRFSGNDWRLRLISFLNNYRCRRTRVVYGDQAMFVRRKLFNALGGFPERPILEDLFFSIELTKHTQLLLLDRYVTTDARKFRQRGVWRSFWQVLVILVRIELGLSVPNNFPFFRDAR